MHAQAAADRPEFAPPPQRGTVRAVLLALIAHALLIAALTWGVRWKRDAENDAVEAELWSTTVQQAAPRAVTPPPAPAPRPAPPPPPPPPPQAVQPPPAPPAPKQPDINLEREKKLREQKEQRERELEQQKQEKKKQEAAERAKEKKELEAKKREQEEAERKKEQQKQAELKKKEEAAKQAAAAQATKDRQEAIRRMQAMAGTGAENSTGTAQRSSGPSGSYGAKVAAAVRPNVVFPDADLVSGNPAAEFDVRLAPDGTIIGTPALVKSSGLGGWDEAALRALQKTEKLPRDVDGTVPPRLLVALRPKR
jgi:colicin import membrane protein